jgi:predicted DNA-binding WGR domain protein
MKYEFIGWCCEDNHDKVWVAINLQPGKWLTVWGRRGAKLQTKMMNSSSWDMQKLINKKRAKGYDGLQKQGLDHVYPEFETDLEKVAIWSMLTA